MKKALKTLTIGLVLCIAMSIVVIPVGAQTTPTPKVPSASLVVDGADVDTTNIILIHHGGDMIVDAFKGSAPYWNSLEVRINGAIHTGTIKLNGAMVSAGDFKPGDELEFFLGWKLSDGDTITVIYTPTGDILQRVKVAGEVKVPNAALVIEGARVGNTEITVIHHGGDTIVDAFKGNAPYWNSLEVRINGVIYMGTVKLNGDTVSAGDFKPGNELKLFLGWELFGGDTISVVYTPTGDILQRVKVAGPVITPTPPPITPTPTVSPTPSTVTPMPAPTSAGEPEPELSISQSSLKEEPEVGEEVLITIAILNKGKATAKNIHLEERIPSSISVNYVEGADKAGGLVYWNGELEPGESHSITHTLRILEEKSRAIPVTVTYEDASGKTKQKSTEIYLTAEPVPEVPPTPSPLSNIPWVYIIVLVAVVLVGLAIIVAVRRGGEGGGGAEVTIEENK